MSAAIEAILAGAVARGDTRLAAQLEAMREGRLVVDDPDERLAIQEEPREKRAEQRTAEPAKPAKKMPPLVELITGAALFEPIPPTKWLAEGLEMAPGAPSVWAGFGFTGKSYAAQALALAVATGRDAWGSFACREGKALHLDYEQGRHLTLKRYQKLARGMGIGPDDIGDRLAVAPLPKLSLATPLGERWLTQNTEGVSLCIVDSFRAACPEVDENSSEARRPLDMMTRVSEATGCSFVVLHHARKPSKDSQGGAKMSMRGSSGLFDAAASVLVFESGKKGGPSIVKHEKARISGKLADDFGLEIRDVLDGQGRFDGVEVVTKAAPSAGAGGVDRAAEGAKIQSGILEALANGPLGANQLETACREGGLEFRASDFRRNRDAMVEGGAVAVASGPRRGTIYSLPGGQS